jgi:hypothetical protein
MSQPTYPLHLVMMNNASTRGITASAGTPFDSTIPCFSCRHYLIKQNKTFILFSSAERDLQSIQPSSLFNHFPIKLFAHCRGFPTAAQVSLVRTLSQLRRDCTFFNTS